MHARTISSFSLRFAAPLVAAALLASGCSGGNPAGTALPASPSSASLRSAATMTFLTLDNDRDLTFNQLLGINDRSLISGYYGSGATGHPNKGYLLASPYTQKNYTPENYPGSKQTQVTGLNNLGDTSGFWVDGKGVNHGFVAWKGVYTTFDDPKTGKGTVNQVLGINDSGIAAGFYVDAAGVSHGYTLDQASGKFSPVTPPGASNVTAAAISKSGDVTGFYLQGKKAVGFLRKGTGFTVLNYPHSAGTTPLGINAKDQIVGAYMDAKGKTHGFLLSNPLSKPQWQSIDDPNGIGATTINGINDKGWMVGFYVDSKGNTDGMLIEP